MAPVEDSASEPAPPDHLGHRERLRQRFLKGGTGAVEDYELLELLLFATLPRQDTKAIAKALLRRFGSLAGVFRASPQALMEVKGIKSNGAAILKVVPALAERLAQEEAREHPVISSWDRLLDYCRIALAHETVEQVRVLFLNKRNVLLADELQSRGTVDHAPLYPREVVKRALELGASAMIVVHNHPSGEPTPSQGDIDITRALEEAARPLGVLLHDHLVIGRHGHTSFKAAGLL